MDKRSCWLKTYCSAKENIYTQHYYYTPVHESERVKCFSVTNDRAYGMCECVLSHLLTAAHNSISVKAQKRTEKDRPVSHCCHNLIQLVEFPSIHAQIINELKYFGKV